MRTFVTSATKQKKILMLTIVFELGLMVVNKTRDREKEFRIISREKTPLIKGPYKNISGIFNGRMRLHNLNNKP